jgi:hypothetical protein
MDIASLLFPQAPSYATGLLGEEEAARLQGQARQAGLLNLGLGLLAAGGPAAVRPGLGQGLIQGLSAGQQAYQNVYSQRLQEMELARKIAEQRQQQQMQQMMQQLAPRALSGDPEAMSQLAQFLPPEQLSKFTTAAKTAQEMRTPAKPDYREIGGKLVKVDPITDKTSVVFEPGQTPKLSDLGSLYAAVNFPGTPVDQLKPNQLADILKFQQTPSPKDLADMLIKAETLKAETGIDLTGTIRALSGPTFPVLGTGMPAAPQPTATPSVAQPPAQPTAAPTGVEPTAGMVPSIQNEAIPLKFKNELQVAQPKVVTATRSAIKDLRDLRDAVEQVRNHPGLKTATGFGGQALSAIPGTKAADAAALLDNLKNRNFIAGILNLRQQSPTGSSVGSLTEREGARFENLKAALSQAQTVDQLREQLDILSNATVEAMQGLYDAYQLDYPRNRTLEEDVRKSVIKRQTAPAQTLDDIFKRR